MAVTIKQRAFAGFWFMAAAAFIIVPAFGAVENESPSQMLGFVIWFLLSPLLISGLLGSLIGASILDTQRVRRWWRAALRGLSIAILSYLLQAIVLSMWEGYENRGGFSFSEAFGRTLMMILIGGALIFGWIVAIIGAFAGLILHLISMPLKDGGGLR